MPSSSESEEFEHVKIDEDADSHARDSGQGLQDSLEFVTSVTDPLFQVVTHASQPQYESVPQTVSRYTSSLRHRAVGETVTSMILPYNHALDISVNRQSILEQGLDSSEVLRTSPQTTPLERGETWWIYFLDDVTVLSNGETEQPLF